MKKEKEKEGIRMGNEIALRATKTPRKQSKHGTGGRTMAL